MNKPILAILLCFCSGVIAKENRVIYPKIDVNIISEHKTYNGEKCYDYRGHRVRIFLGDNFSNKHITHIAFSQWAVVRKNSMPIMIFQNRYFQKLNALANIIVYYHECGHHSLGHFYVDKRTPKEQRRQEYDADCYAITRFMIKHDANDLQSAFKSFVDTSSLSKASVLLMLSCLRK